MSRADRQAALARRWLGKARTDLAVALAVLQKGPEMEPWAACFHAQQAAEKALKAVLVAAGVEPPQVHDLRALRARMPAGIALDATDNALAELTLYATGVRYVFDAALGEEDPSWEEAEAAVVTAGRILRAVRAHLGAPV